MAANNNGNASTPSGGAPPGGAGAADPNSVQQGHPRERKGGPTLDAQPEGGEARRQTRKANSISAPRSRGASAGERFEAEEQRNGKQESVQTVRAESKELERAAPVSRRITRPFRTMSGGDSCRSAASTTSRTGPGRLPIAAAG